jgi:hypothetical protein
LLPQLTVTVPIVLLGRKALLHFELIQLPFVYGQDPVAAVRCVSAGSLSLARIVETQDFIQYEEERWYVMFLNETRQPLMAPLASATLMM